MKPPLSKKRYQIGLIGLGFGRQVHFPAFSHHNRCEIVGVCDRNEKKTSDLATKFGISGVTNNWQQIVADPNIDIVAIATQPESHWMIAKAAIENGKHVFVEKPLGCGLLNAQELLKISQQKNCKVVVDFEFPKIAAMQIFQNLVNKGELGQIRHIFYTWQIETYAYRNNQETWKTKPQRGGGVVNLFGSHVFQLIEWLFGSLIRLRADIIEDLHGNEAILDLIAINDRGVTIFTNVSTNSFLGLGHAITVHGDRGTLRMSNKGTDYANGFVIEAGYRSEGCFVEVPTNGLFETSRGQEDGRISAVSAMLDQLIQAIERDDLTSTNLDVGCRVEYLIEQSRKSSSLGKWVDLEVPYGNR